MKSALAAVKTSASNPVGRTASNSASSQGLARLDLSGALQRPCEDAAVGGGGTGPDPERHRAAIQEYADAGYDHVYVHQIGPDQDGFFDFYEREILPGFS